MRTSNRKRTRKSEQGANRLCQRERRLATFCVYCALRASGSREPAAACEAPLRAAPAVRTLGVIILKTQETRNPAYCVGENHLSTPDAPGVEEEE